MNNQQILNNMSDVQEANKSMRQDMSDGKALLNPEQLANFLTAMQLPNVILDAADFKLMTSFEKILSRVDISGRVLRNGYTSTGETNANIESANVTYGANVLNAKKFKAEIEIEDDEREDNLEGDQLDETLLTLMGERIGEDLQFWALFADSTIGFNNNPFLTTTDGWIKLAGQQLKSTSVDSSNGQFDLADGVENMFDKMIKSIPPRFRQQRQNLAFYVPYEVEDAYRNILKARGTALGDASQIGFANLSYKGIPVIHCVTLDAEDGRGIDNTSTSILTNPQNMAYGIWQNITIEPERKPGDELTKYWYRMRGDIDYYFREACSVAKLSEDETEELPAASGA